jgi:hypothetical protein
MVHTGLAVARITAAEAAAHIEFLRGEVTHETS